MNVTHSRSTPSAFTVRPGARRAVRPEHAVHTDGPRALAGHHHGQNARLRVHRQVGEHRVSGS